MMRRLAPLARSMAPPTPSRGLPGTAQLARLACSSFEAAHDGHVDMAAANHGEGVGAVEIAVAREILKVKWFAKNDTRSHFTLGIC